MKRKVDTLLKYLTMLVISIVLGSSLITFLVKFGDRIPLPIIAFLGVMCLILLAILNVVSDN